MKSKKPERNGAPFLERLRLANDLKRETAMEAYAKGNLKFRRYLLEGEFDADDRAFLVSLFDYLFWDAQGRNRAERPKSQPPYRATRQPNRQIVPTAELSAVLGIEKSDRKAWVAERLGVNWDVLKKRIARLDDAERAKVEKLLGLDRAARIEGAKRARRPV